MRIFHLVALSVVMASSSLYASESDSKLEHSVVPQLKVSLVKVDKSKRRMYLMDGTTVLKEYRIALGKEPKGHKLHEGDNRTPEGHYRLDYVTEESSFYRSVHISYPHLQDIIRAGEFRLSPGGDIKIHGLKNGESKPPQFIQSFDWTNGCIALTNQEMDEFIELVEMGTPIHIEW